MPDGISPIDADAISAFVERANNKKDGGLL
jgi:hypothetical protein